MQATSPQEDLISLCAEALLGANPDPSGLQDNIVRRSGLDAAAAQQLIYDTVLTINRQLFPSLSKVELLLIEGCNMGCHYCFESSVLQSSHAQKRRMSPEVIRKGIDLLCDYGQPQDEIDVTLFGGEPTLNFDGIRFATEYAEAKSAQSGRSLRFNMTTNGLLVTGDMLEYIADHKIKILLSVDGLSATHDRYRIDKKGSGTFDRVIETLSRLKKRQPWMGVKMTVMPSEAGHLFENVLGLYELGANQFLIGNATGPHIRWSEEAMNTYASQMRLVRDWYKSSKAPDVRITELDEEADEHAVFGCTAARNTIAIRANGEISGCSRIATLEGQRTVGKLGDVDFGLYCLKSRMDMVSCERLVANVSKNGMAGDYRAGCFAVNYEESRDLYRPSHIDYELRKRVADKTRA